MKILVFQKIKSYRKLFTFKDNTVIKSVLVSILFFVVSNSKAQVGIGTIDPSPSSQLDIVSTDKGILIPRVNLTSSTDNATITNGNVVGLLVFNTNVISDIVQGFYYWDGAKWVRLGSGSSTTTGNSITANVTTLNNSTTIQAGNKAGDLIWVKSYGPNKKSTLLVWDGASWTPVSEDYDATNELGLKVAANATDRDTQFPSPNAGDQVWNKTCACIQVYDATSWIDIGAKSTNSPITVINGLTQTANQVELGGSLTKPTTITTTTTNTLAVKGLEQGALTTQNNIVVIDKTTGVLKQAPATSLFQEEVVLITATDGQNRFNVPLPITDPKKINVYRNGVIIDFTKISDTTIELETGVLCYKEDQIRIVQFN